MATERFVQFQRLVSSFLLLAVFCGLIYFVHDWVKTAQIKHPNQTLVFGLIDDTPPFCFYDEHNQLSGINIDLANEIGRRLKRPVQIQSVSFNRLISGLMTHQFDVVSIGSVTSSRAKVVHYVTPHLVSADVLIVHPELKAVQRIKEFVLQPWHIGVYNGTSYIQLLKERGLEKNMIIYPTQRDVFLAFYKHRCDAIIMNEHVARYIQGHLDPSMVIVPERIRTDRKYAFAVKKDNTQLAQQLDSAIQDMLLEGTVDSIMTKWLGTAHASS